MKLIADEQLTTTSTVPTYLFRGEIWNVDFGDETKEGQNVYYGRRPAVIISNNVGNRYSNVVTVCLLSSKQMKREYPTHLKLEPNEMNKLRVPSTIMAEQVRTIGKERLQFKVGKLTVKEEQQLNEVLKISFHL